MSTEVKNHEIQFGKKVFLRDAGLNEHWLQDMLYENPSMLGFGDYLTTGKRDKRAGSHGRFHISLTDVINDILYEVDVMLGEIDAAHIINSLESWDNRERKRRQTSNYTVSVAESFEGRYFNLLHTLSMKLPLLVIQLNLLVVDNEYVLSFSKLFDLYRSSNDSDEEEETTVNEALWSDKSPWTLKVAKDLYDLIDADDKSLDYEEDHITIRIQGRRAYRLERSSEPNSIVSFTVFDDEKVTAIKDVFYNYNFAPYNLNRQKEFVIAVNETMINSKKSIFQEILRIRYSELLSHR